MRDKVFVSYSHKDGELCTALRQHLAAYGLSAALEVWSDEDVEPGKKWHDEIRRAMDSALVFVCLVSQDFLASRWIKEHEIPVMVRAARQQVARLVPVFAGPSAVQDDRSAYVVDGQRVKLSDYQGEETPERTLSELGEVERARALVAIARRIADLFESLRAPEARALPAIDLTVRLERADGSVRQTYATARGRVGGDQCPGRDVAGKAPFELLFPRGDAAFAELLRAIWRDAPQDLTPLALLLRVTLESDDPDLLAVPWSETRWHGQRLVDHGWTFQLARPASARAPYSVRPALDRNARVLLLGSEPAPGHTFLPHLQVLRNQLADAFATESGTDHHHVHEARTLAEARQHAAEPFDVVYYFGAAEVDDAELSLVLAPADRVDLRGLAALFEAGVPKLLFLNLIGPPLGRAASALGMLPDELPLAVVQTARAEALAGKDDDPRERARLWFERLLGTDEPDPVATMFEVLLPSAVAWGRIERLLWEPVQGYRHVLDPYLALDRIRQRQVVFGALQELREKPARRVIAHVAFGTTENRVELFGRQAADYFRRHAENVRVRSHTFHVPEAAKSSAAWAEALAGELQGDPPLRDLLPKLRPRTATGPYSVLLFDWTAIKAGRDLGAAREVLRPWAELCAGELARAVPDDLRVIALLSIVCEPEVHDDVEQAVRELDEDLNSEKAHLSPLPPLREVQPAELRQYLEDRASLCPPEWVREAAALIHAGAAGRFAETADLLARARREHWGAFLTRQRERFPEVAARFPR